MHKVLYFTIGFMYFIPSNPPPPYLIVKQKQYTPWSWCIAVTGNSFTEGEIEAYVK